jgi:hypothetical protein
MIRSLFAVCCLLVAPACHAAHATFTVSQTFATPPQIQSDPTLGGQSVWKFFVTTDADIQSIEDVLIVSDPPYQHPLGTDTEPPSPGLVSVFPALGADSWITTPGSTLVFGGFGMPNSAWVDLSDDGPVNNFQFAQITAPVFLLFTGTLKLVGLNQAIEAVPFAFIPLPEPSSAILAAAAFVGALTRRRARALS